jgi:tripartite-type tricarboxylate transporter receptor subunit TctC
MKVGSAMRWLASACLGTAMTLVPAIADEAYPARNVEVIVPYAAGGGVSNMARAFAAEASRLTSKQWVVMNREGAGGIVGFTAIAKARPDGYTIGFSPASPMTNSPFVNSRMPFQNDQVEPVCQVFENVFAIVVRENSPLTSMKDLVSLAKARPGAISYGHAGPASIPHLAVGAIEKSGNLKFNGIAYRGDGPAMTDLMGGTLDFGAFAISSLAGKNFRVLAVLSDKPNPGLPGVPPITEFGFKAISPGLNGLYVPAGTPKNVVNQLEAICRKVVNSNEFIQAAAGMKQVPLFTDAAAFRARIEDTYKVHAELVPTLGIQKD